MEETVFRLDKGLTSGTVLDIINRLRAGCVAKLKLSPTVDKQISQIEKWRAIGNGHVAAHISCKRNGWSRPRRMAVIERTLPAKEQLAPLPFLS